MTTIPIEPIAFSQEWERAWNSRDLEAVLAHFHDEAVFTSPIAVRLGIGNRGEVRGKRALRDYWTAALSKNPELHLTVTQTFGGVRTLVICFQTQTGEARVEVLTFRDGLVVEGHGLIAVSPAGESA